MTHAPAAMGAFLLDLPDDAVRVSAGLRRLAGLGPDADCTGRDALLARLHPADRVRFDHALREAAVAEEPVALRVHLGADDGSARRVRVVLTGERDPEGRPRCVRGSVEEAPGRTGRERDWGLREALDQVPHQVLLKDAEGRVLLANRAVAAVYGLTPTEMEGRLHQDLHPVPEVVARMLADDRDVIATGRAKHVHEEAFRDLAGRDHLLDTVKIPVHSGGRDLVLGVAVDVTQRRRALDTGWQLSLALRQAVEGIALVDVEGTIVFANPALAHMLDMEPDALMGAPFSVTSSGSADDESLLREMSREIACGRAWMGRYESHWRDGSRHVRDASVTPVRDAEGRPLGIVAVLRDVSREVELEEELHQAQKMEAVGRLAGGVAHDFNNVLTVIAACAEELDQALTPGSPEWEAAREIARATERSAEIIGQLLAFSRRTPLRPEALAPNAVVEKLVSMLERLLPAGVRLDLALDPRAAAVRADRGQLERALVNLVLNARDAMPEGGRLTMATALAPGGTEVILSIRDTGVGMDRDTRRRAFEPFFTTKGPGRGSGLGLAAVLGFARQSGGSVDVESEPGRGTVVSLRLPTADVAQGAAAAGPSDPARGERSARVLVVEDEDAIRALIARTLERAGYRVWGAEDGCDALELLEREGAVDLVLADVRMPRMGGPELRRALAARSPEIVVLLMSGFPGVDDREAEPALIAKPFRPSALLRAVREALGEHADASPKPESPDVDADGSSSRPGV